MSGLSQSKWAAKEEPKEELKPVKPAGLSTSRWASAPADIELPRDTPLKTIPTRPAGKSTDTSPKKTPKPLNESESPSKKPGNDIKIQSSPTSPNRPKTMTERALAETEYIKEMIAERRRNKDKKSRADLEWRNQTTSQPRHEQSKSSRSLPNTHSKHGSHSDTKSLPDNNLMPHHLPRTGAAAKSGAGSKPPKPKPIDPPQEKKETKPVDLKALQAELDALSEGKVSWADDDSDFTL